MNFKHMPELTWQWGYPATLTAMGVIMIAMISYFKKRKWF
jgi:magnesium transporter